LKRFILDCSSVLCWFFEDEKEQSSQSTLSLSATAEVIVPAIWPFEIANTLLVAERRNRIEASRTREILDLLREFSIHVDEESLDQTFYRTLFLARTCKLSVYDASYLELAIRKKLPLATLDKALARAAGKCGVKVF